MVIKTNKHSIFYALFVTLVALVFVRYTLQIDVPRILLTIVVIAAAFFGDRNEALAISMCCIPLHNAINLYVSVAFCTLILFLKFRNNIKINYSLIIVLTMIVWELLHGFSSDFSAMSFFCTVILLCFLVLIINIDVKKIDYVFIARTMAMMSLIISLIILANFVVQANYNIAIAFTNIRRLGYYSEDDMLFGSGINPNALGIINVICMTALLQIWSSGERKATDIITVLFLLVFGILTSSRTFLACLAIMFLLLTISGRGKINKKIRFFMLIILCTILGYFIIKTIFPNLLEYYIARFNTTDITSGRNMIFNKYNEYIMSSAKSLLFGMGLNNFSEKVTVIYNISNAVPHNGIQEIILAWGIPGLIFFSMFMFDMIMSSRKTNKHQKLINYIPLIIIFAKIQVGQFITSGYTMIALAFCYLSLCHDFYEDEYSLETEHLETTT